MANKIVVVAVVVAFVVVAVVVVKQTTAFTEPKTDVAQQNEHLKQKRTEITEKESTHQTLS